MLAAARAYSAACAGRYEDVAEFPVIMAAAGFFGVSGELAVLTAARWQEWLHPRGIDGRFIEALSFVDVFADKTDDGKTVLRDAKANRRRARVTELFPEGARMQYFDVTGKPIPAEPKAGYPSLIPLVDIGKKVASAPASKARLVNVSSKEEFDAGRGAAEGVGKGYKEPMSQADYDIAVRAFNAELAKLQPERSKATKGGAELTDDEYDEHLAYVTDVTNLGLGAKHGQHGEGLASERAFKDEYGRWGQEALAQMLTFSTELYSQLTEGKPQGHKAMVIGGLPGSGKSSLLKSMDKEGSLKLADWVSINPDDVKEAMIDKGWYPKIDGLTPGDTAGFIHAQSSEIASMIERMAMKDGYNLIFDVTLGDTPNADGKSFMDYTLGYLKAYGYDSPDGLFISSSKEHSLQSVYARHRNGLNAYRTGQGRDESAIKMGGRFVPAKVVQGEASQSEAINQANFERLKSQFGKWSTYAVGSAPGEAPNPSLTETSSTVNSTLGPEVEYRDLEMPAQVKEIPLSGGRKALLVKDFHKPGNQRRGMLAIVDSNGKQLGNFSVHLATDDDNPDGNEGNFTVAVAPEARGKGVGSELMKLAEDTWGLDPKANHYTDAGAGLMNAYLAKKQGKVKPFTIPDPDSPDATNWNDPAEVAARDAAKKEKLKAFGKELELTSEINALEPGTSVFLVDSLGNARPGGPFVVTGHKENKYKEQELWVKGADGKEFPVLFNRVFLGPSETAATV